MNKKVRCVFAWLIVVLYGCNMNSGSDNYYMQQQDEDDGTSGTVSEDLDVVYEKIFEVLRPNAVIDVNALSEYSFTPIQLENIIAEMSILPIENPLYNSILEYSILNTNSIKEFFVRSTFLSDGLLEIGYYDTAMPWSWSVSSDTTYLKSLNSNTSQYTYEYSGTPIQMYMEGLPFANMIDVVYYKYDGYNPFFSLESKYNNNVVGETDERGMERFIFYRLTGSVLTMAQDTMLMAVDTYTSLVYSYAVVTELLKIGDMYIPSKWEAVDSVATDSSGNKHLFFEYDPAGYIDCNYNFFEFDWYKSQKISISQNPTNMKLYFPKYSGVSPYVVRF